MMCQVEAGLQLFQVIWLSNFIEAWTNADGKTKTKTGNFEYVNVYRERAIW